MTGWIPRHSREGGNPLRHSSFPRRRESTPSFVIPAKAGIHNSRACGNSTKKHHPDQPDTSLPHRTTSTSFPRKREFTPSSVILAKTGLHPVIRHSREGGNPPRHLSFPRRRESTIPLNSACAGIVDSPVIPAKAGIHPVIAFAGMTLR